MVDGPREDERCGGGYCMNPGGADGDLNQEDSAADGDERGFKRCGAGEDSVGPAVDECRAMQELGSSLC